MISHRPAVMYNLGLQHLMLHNYQVALSCFDFASSQYYMQPLLWLRMAESCIGLYHERMQVVARQNNHQSVGSLGHGSSSSSSSSGCLAEACIGQEGYSRMWLLPGGSSKAHVQAATLQQSGSYVQVSTLTDTTLDTEAGASNTAAKTESGMHKQQHDKGLFESVLEQALQHLSACLALLQDLKAEAAKESEDATAAMAVAATAGVTSSHGVDPALHANGHGMSVPLSMLGGNGAVLISSSSGSGSMSCIRVCDGPSVAELEPVQQAALANAAYVHLVREDAVPALSAAQALLACSSLSPQQHFLGSCYAAEAFCMLGKPAVAAEQLHSHMILYMDADGSSLSPTADATAGGTSTAGAPTSIKSDDDGSSRECYSLGNAADLALLTGPAARACLMVNLASVFALQGDLEQCMACAQQALAVEPANRSARLLVVYAELSKGNSDAALTWLKQGRILEHS